MSKHTVNMEEVMKINARRQVTQARRVTNARKGLLPIVERLNAQQLANREGKIWARRTVADRLSAQQAMLGRVLHNFFARGLFGRLKWFLSGR